MPKMQARFKNVFIESGSNNEHGCEANVKSASYSSNSNSELFQ